MARVDEDAWIPKAKKRKAYRDHYREKFFSEVGLRKGSHVQQISGAPADQLGIAQALLNVTAKGDVLDDTHKTMIKNTATVLLQVGLGHGAMGTVTENRTILDKYSMKNLRKRWFYSPAFFD